MPDKEPRPDIKVMNEKIMAECRANGGRAADGTPLPYVIITTTGRKSGKQHTTPVCVRPDGDSLVIAASRGGLAKHPQWYLNLQADPELTVEYLGETYTAIATTVPNSLDRDRLFAIMAEEIKGLYQYQDKCREFRQIPVIRLDRK